MRHWEFGFCVGWLAGAIAMCLLYECDLAAWQKVVLTVLIYSLTRFVVGLLEDA